MRFLRGSSPAACCLFDLESFLFLFRSWGFEFCFSFIGFDLRAHLAFLCRRSCVAGGWLGGSPSALAGPGRAYSISKGNLLGGLSAVDLSLSIKSTADKIRSRARPQSDFLLSISVGFSACLMAFSAVFWCRFMHLCACDSEATLAWIHGSDRYCWRFGVSLLLLLGHHPPRFQNPKSKPTLRSGRIVDGHKGYGFVSISAPR